MSISLTLEEKIKLKLEEKVRQNSLLKKNKEKIEKTIFRKYLFC